MVTCISLAFAAKTDLSLGSADKDKDKECPLETPVGGGRAMAVDTEALSAAEETIEREAPEPERGGRTYRKASRKNQGKMKG